MYSSDDQDSRSVQKPVDQKKHVKRVVTYSCNLLMSPFKRGYKELRTRTMAASPSTPRKSAPSISSSSTPSPPAAATSPPNTTTAPATAATISH
nr:hypothetical protein HmN_000952900 [Hymenolepis microstoma]